MRNLKKASNVDIERQLIADADSVDAWDAAIKVAPSKSPRPEWYRQRRTPIGMTLANCRGINGEEVYEFIARNVPGTSAYAFRPKGRAAVLAIPNHVLPTMRS